MKTLLDDGANVDAQKDDGWTPLHMAAYNNYTEAMALLLTYSAKPNIQNNLDRTPMHIAANKGHIHIVKHLLEKNASIRIQDTYGWTPMHIAANKGHIHIVTELLEYNASIRIQDADGYTPLHLAAEKGHESVVAALLNQCVDTIEQRCFANEAHNYRALHFAAKKGYVNIVALLLEAETLLQKKTDTPLQNFADDTPVHLAAKNNHVEVMDLLLRAGASIDTLSREGYSPLHLATIAGHKEAVEFLLTESASIDLPSSQYNQELAIITDTEDDTEDDHAPKKGMQNTALHYAVANNHQTIVEILLANNAKIDCQNAFSVTPLYKVATYGKIECSSRISMMELLLQKGADPNLKNINGDTLLTRSILRQKENEIIEIIALLIKYRANLTLTITGSDNNTPLHLAAERGFTNVVTLLLNHGADVHATNRNGQTPLQLARKEKEYPTPYSNTEDIAGTIEILEIAEKKRKVAVDPNSKKRRKLSNSEDAVDSTSSPSFWNTDTPASASHASSSSTTQADTSPAATSSTTQNTL